MAKKWALVIVMVTKTWICFDVQILVPFSLLKRLIRELEQRQWQRQRKLLKSNESNKNFARGSQFFRVHFLFASLHDLCDVPIRDVFGEWLITLAKNFLSLFKLGCGLPIIQFQENSLLFDIFRVPEISFHMAGFGSVSIITAYNKT